MAIAVTLNWSRNNNESVHPVELEPEGNEDAPKKGVRTSQVERNYFWS